MKRILTIVGLALQLSGCSQDGTTTPEDNNKSTLESHPAPSDEALAKDENMLTIHGKDIWVRDSSPAGPVIMKLNEGDRCKVLQRGLPANVKGVDDFWYLIEYNGVHGWVFGSQSDWKLVPFLLEGAWCGPMQAPEYLEGPGWDVFGASDDEAWGKWRTKVGELCRFKSKIPEMQSEEDWGEVHWEIEDLEYGSFKLTHTCGDGTDNWTFKSNGEMLKNLWLTKVELFTSAGSVFNRTLVWTFKSGGMPSEVNKGYWELSDQIDGELMEYAYFPTMGGNDTALLAFRTGWWQPLMGGDGVSIWMLVPGSHSFTFVQELSSSEWYADESQGPQNITAIEFIQNSQNPSILDLSIARADSTEEKYQWNRGKRLYGVD
jgi:hypothetical protein